MQNRLCRLGSTVPFFFLLCALATTSCKRSPSSKATSSSQEQVDLHPVKNDRMTLRLEANPLILNPIIATDGYSRAITSEIFDRLVSYNTETALAESSLAESWVVSKDGLNYEFSLRKNAYFHDGHPVTASDVKFTFDRIRDPKVDAAHLQNYFQPLESVTVVDPTHIQFRFKYNYYRNLIIIGSTEILPQHIYGEGDFNKNPANRAPIGSGPYQLSKWESGRSVLLKRFEKHWGSSDPVWKDRNNFQQILYRIIPESTVAVMAMKKGDIDSMDLTPAMYRVDFADPSYEKSHYKLNYTTIDGAGYGYMGWNLKNPLFQSAKVRRALALLMPLEDINEKIYGKTRIQAVGPFPQTSDKTDPSVKPVPYDPALAKKLLAEEGFRDTNGDSVLDKNGKPFRFELLFPPGNPDTDRVALIYQQSLKEVGIDLTLRNLEWTVFNQQRGEGKFDAVFMAWGSSLDSDPYQIWHSSQAVKGGSNYIGYKNEKVDELLTQARSTLDREKRNALYREFSKIIAEDQPYLFVFERPNLALIDRRFEGVLPLGKLGLDSSRWFTPLGREKFKENSALSPQ